jgi:hypothetical protein
LKNKTHATYTYFLIWRITGNIIQLTPAVIQRFQFQLFNLNEKWWNIKIVKISFSGKPSNRFKRSWPIPGTSQHYVKEMRKATKHATALHCATYIGISGEILNTTSVALVIFSTFGLPSARHARLQQIFGTPDL